MKPVLRIIKERIPYALGLLIFIFILSRIDVPSTLDILLSTNIFYFLIAVLLLALMFIPKIIRWRYIMSLQGINYSFKDSLVMYSSALFFGLITPGRLGEIVKASYLKRDGHSIGKSVFSVIFDRLFDVLFLLIFGYIAMFFFAAQFKIHLYAISFSLVFVIAAFVFIILKKDLTINILRWLFIRLIPSRYKDGVKENIKEFYNGLKIFNKKTLGVIVMLTFFSWVAYFVNAFLLAKSLNLNIDFFYFSLSIAIVALVTLIPITFVGIGTRDAALIFFLSIVGISTEATIALSTLILFMTVILGFLCMFAWIKKPVKL
ncbi:MAG: flippase-like domain-containing protein [bacterium]|nr:flippase-like domain-containing protein [bacterium]